MTTYIPFVPSSQAPFQTQVTLDGQDYSAIMTWNVFGQRFYVNLYTLTGTLVFSLPLIASPGGVAIASLSCVLGTVTGATAAPHGYEIGHVCNLTVAGAAPADYNGVFDVLITSPTTFSYAIDSNPMHSTFGGSLNADINLAAGYFKSSTLVYRGPSGQFEITP